MRRVNSWIILMVLITVMHFKAEAQIKKVFFTSGGELIFSSASIGKNHNMGEAKMRFTGVINFNSLIHYNLTDNLGFYTGMELQNLGFFYKLKNAESKTKFRTYNYGVPIGIKLGIKRNLYFFTAYSLEVPIHFKEKTFVEDEVSHNSSDWFSKKTPFFAHSLSFGIQLPYGFGIKAKYYLNNFFNKNYEAIEQGMVVRPYQHIDAHLFYISVTYNMLKNKRIDFNPFYN